MIRRILSLTLALVVAIIAFVIIGAILPSQPTTTWYLATYYLCLGLGAGALYVSSIKAANLFDNRLIDLIMLAGLPILGFILMGTAPITAPAYLLFTKYLLVISSVVGIVVLIKILLDGKKSDRRSEKQAEKDAEKAVKKAERKEASRRD